VCLSGATYSDRRRGPILSFTTTTVFVAQGLPLAIAGTLALTSALRARRAPRGSDAYKKAQILTLLAGGAAVLVLWPSLTAARYALEVITHPGLFVSGHLGAGAQIGIAYPLNIQGNLQVAPHILLVDASSIALALVVVSCAVFALASEIVLNARHPAA
jgi:hypothetical protein